jgi:hypothetical protein
MSKDPNHESEWVADTLGKKFLYLAIVLFVVSIPFAVYFSIIGLQNTANYGLNNEQIDKIKESDQFIETKKVINDLQKNDPEAYKAFQESVATNVGGMVTLRAAEQKLKKYNSSPAKKARKAINDQIDSLVQDRNYASFDGKERGAQLVVTALLPNIVKPNEAFKEAAESLVKILKNKEANDHVKKAFEKLFQVPDNVSEDEAYRLNATKIAALKFDSGINYKQQNNISLDEVEKAVVKLVNAHKLMQDLAINGNLTGKPATKEELKVIYDSVKDGIKIIKAHYQKNAS